MMLAAGLFLVGGHTFVFLAFRFARAAAVAPFYYTFTLWAVLSGLIVFGDVPNWLSIHGNAAHSHQRPCQRGHGPAPDKTIGAGPIGQFPRLS